jgi:hypothetical protein
MNAISRALLCIFFVTSSGAADPQKPENIIIYMEGEYSYANSERLWYTYTITPQRSAAQPKWKPGQGSIPLTIDEATKIALAYIAKQSWHKHWRSFERISLLRYIRDDETKWVYNFARPYDIQDAIAEVPDKLYVLLDGTVVEPATSTNKPEQQ